MGIHLLRKAVLSLLSHSKMVNLSGKLLSQQWRVKWSVAPWKMQPFSNPLNFGRTTILWEASIFGNTYYVLDIVTLLNV